MNRTAPLTELLDRHPLPVRTGGKDESGTLVIVGGPPSCPGAVILAARAALRVGCGRVQLVVHPDVAAATATAVPETLVIAWGQRGSLPDDVRDQLRTADAVVIGSGHDRLPSETVCTVADTAVDAAVVLDAGALGAARDLSYAANLVLAPNAREAEDLTGDRGDEATLAVRLAAQLDRAVAVRGPVTVIADGDARWAFDDAPPGLGTPGSGDVLIGTLGGLLAGGLEPVAALGWAVALHARAGALLAGETPVGYLASDIATRLPHALVALASEHPSLASARST
jgi:ADP-dependent NAD(P)H-hydrate dehydratase